MRALILVAGHGSRLRSASGDTPKSLIEVGGKTLLDRQIETMRGLGVERICLATGFRHEAFEARYGDSVDYRYNPFFRESNNIVSFLFARDWVLGHDLVVCYGDLIYDADLLSAVMRSSVESGLTVDPGQVEEGHALAVLEGDRVLKVGRSVRVSEAHARFVGIARFSSRGVSRLMPEIEAQVRDGKLQDYYLVAVQSLIEQGLPISPIDVTGCRWTEIDFPEDLAAARHDWA